ncbi:MAG: FixH family protein [Anaerolineae bacterium]|nr:FixH family protein [Anaerolineae bacterium]
MKSRWFLLALMLLVAAGCGQVAAEVQPVNDLAIELVVEPSPPAAGEATLIITVTDASGTPIDGAIVRAHGDMDHAGMESVDGQTAESTAGVYRVPFTWTMGGGWILDVTVALPNNRGSVTRRFELFVEAVSHDSILHESSGQASNGDDQPVEAPAEKHSTGH